ncbi:metal-sensing transcriptional repressor [Mycobacterium sp.]|uniref:metal-sensing transcriptional repressor n=1 Tax=Mycobacterium sp. TaxID=1785 RepID=UPI0025CE5BEA|nr:metal-sensing transcriptional repressor [Mycobacterium sp.]
MALELPAAQHAALHHVNTALAQLVEVTRMLQSDTCCVDVMRQVQAVQCLLERVHRATMHKHLQTSFVEAVLYGREQAAIEELVDAVKFTPAWTAHIAQSAIAPVEIDATTALLTATTLSLPGIVSPRCQAAIEAIVTAIAGVGAVEVDLPTKTITIHHDNRASSRHLIGAIEEQGYHIADPLLTERRMSGRGHGAEGVPRPRSDAPAAVPDEQHASRAWLGFLDGDGI